MPYLFAHSEQAVKHDVRKKRGDALVWRKYGSRMKLRITELRKERGLTVEALADKAGMSKSYLSEIASGKKPVSSRRIDSLARALGCNPIDLIDDESVDPNVIQHVRLLSRLSLEDRTAVIRHAAVLAMKDEEVG